MTEPSQLPLPPGGGRREADDGHIGAGRSYPDGERPPASHSVPAALAAFAVVVAGTAALGAAAGLLWMSLAPRALAVVIGPGSANVVNPETSAFIAADGWFVLLTAAGGIMSGLLGYALAVRRHGALAMTGILAGGLAATLIAMWIGQHSGAAAFNRSLAIGRPGTLLRVPLALGGHGPLAFWPLAAGLTAGGIELIVALRERHGFVPRHGGPAAPSDRATAPGEG
jgi:hypothetical protein